MLTMFACAVVLALGLSLLGLHEFALLVVVMLALGLVAP